MSDLVSVIMPCFNAVAYLDEAIESVMRQSYSQWELLIVDDCSTDATADFIDKWCLRDNRIKGYRLKQNGGAAIARNYALKEAKGRYVALLDSDDMWHERKLERQLAFMKEVGAPLTYTSYKIIDEDGNIIANVFNAPEQTTYAEMLQDSVIGCPTAMYDSSVLGKVEMPDVFHADYATWLKILRDGHKAKGLQEPLAYYRIRKGSLNRNKAKAAWHRWRVYRNCEQLSTLKSLKHFLIYAYHGVIG